MNYAYMIYGGKIDDIVYNCIKTLNKYNNCQILFYMVDYIDYNKKILKEFKNIEYFKVDQSEWLNKRMSCKILKIPINKLSFGDKLYVLDTDLIFQGEIFERLDDIDIAITGRNHKYIWCINAGVWGFNYNSTSKSFIKFYQNQLLDPSWEPFVNFTKHHNHYKNMDWWCDQDFLCVVKNNKLPFDCNIKDIGYKYNFCPYFTNRDINTRKKAIQDILNVKGNSEYKVLHLKGKLKEIYKKVI